MLWMPQKKGWMYNKRGRAAFLPLPAMEGCCGSGKSSTLILGVRGHKILCWEGYPERVGWTQHTRSIKQVHNAYHASWDPVIFREEEEENQSGSQFSAMHCWNWTMSLLVTVIEITWENVWLMWDSFIGETCYLLFRYFLPYFLHNPMQSRIYPYPTLHCPKNSPHGLVSEWQWFTWGTVPVRVGLFAALYIKIEKSNF